jgi:hypothetical protein
VWWLTAQTFAFGVTAALVGVVANAMFLDAYGSGWLPATYIVIGATGVLVSAGIARSSRRFDLVPIAVTVLGVITLAFAFAWVVARDGGGSWVSGPMLVLFAILIQLGFVFVGMQAGRVLDIAGIKAAMPRIMAGFPVGAIAGGLVVGPLVAALGRTEALLLPTALAQAAFTGLVLVTGRRYAALLSRPPEPASSVHGGEEDRGTQRRGVLRLLAGRFVLLVLLYQVLSALGSQLVDFLVMDRAAARYPASEDLARFVAGYTAVMNLVIIVFLVTLAGPLLRRYGLRLGIAANPAVVTVLAVATALVYVVAGGSSLALLLMVSATRVVDLALSDGTTRTSVNAMYQVLPPASRLEAQATIEGMGVPLAIAASGVVIIVVNLLPAPLPVMIATTVLVCAAWTWAAGALHRSYRPALAESLRRRPLLDEAAVVEAGAEEAAAVRRLVARGDAEAVRTALAVVDPTGPAVPLTELRALARDPGLEVRLTALAGLAAAGDRRAAERLAGQVEEAARSTAPSVRHRVALVVDRVAEPRRWPVLAALLADEAPEVRRAALTAGSAADGEAALEPALTALRDPATAAAAVGAVRRLGTGDAGPALVSALDVALTASGATTDPWVHRLVAAVPRSPERDEVLACHLGHPDLAVGAEVLEALAGDEAAAGPVAADAEAALVSDARAALWLLAVQEALEPELAGEPADRALRRAVQDELDLLGRRVAGCLTVRHGRRELGDALRVLADGVGEVGVAVETLEVVAGRAAATLALPLLDPRLEGPERLDRLRAALPGAVGPSRPEDPVGAVVEARRSGTPSPWLRACALAAASAHGTARRLDLAEPRRVEDPVLAEQLAAVR